MFDDPKKELKRLQDRLLAAEEPEWEPPEVDADTAFAEVEAILEKDDREKEKQFHMAALSEDAEPDEDDELPKKSRFAGLLTALILETLVLVGLVAWWVLWR